jgi:transcription initiation factor TFIIA large subunit
MSRVGFVLIYLEHLEMETKDFLLAQYEKVHRVKNKWKCTFKDAILHINGKEYVFEKVVGELERDW